MIRLLFSLFFIWTQFGWSQQTSFYAGAAYMNITPAFPVPLSGYADRAQPSQGVHDSIYARAFVFEQGATQACIIQADLIGFSFEFVEELTGQIEIKTGIPAKNCLLVAAHNHGGPSTRAYGETATDHLTAYLDQLKKSLVDAVQMAWTKREPARIGYGEGLCRMNINRRARHAEGGIWLGRNPDGPCDHRVDVIRLENLAGKPLGLLINWPCHATVGGQENSLVTGDWPGATVRYLEKNGYIGIPIGVFAGASGDINPIYGPHNNFREMNAVGLVLSEEVLRAVKDIPMVQPLKLEVRQVMKDIPGKQKSATRLPGEKIVPGEPVPLRWSVLQLGPLVICGISGELMTEIGMDIKRVSPFRHTVLMTHCNGNSGYLCTDAAYAEGGYEPMVSRTRPGTAQLIKEQMLQLLNGLFK